MRCGDVLPTSRHRGALLEAHTIVVRTPLTARSGSGCGCGCAVTAAAWLWLWLWLGLTADSVRTPLARSPSPALRGKLRFQLDRSSPTGEDRLAFQLPCPLGVLDTLASMDGQRPKRKTPGKPAFFLCTTRWRHLADRRVAASGLRVGRSHRIKRDSQRVASGRQMVRLARPALQ